MERVHKADGHTLWIGESDFGATVTELSRPEFARKIEERRTGGRQFPVGVSHGFEALKLSVKCKGVSLPFIGLIQNGQINGVRLFIRAYLDDEEGGYQTSVEEFQGRCSAPNKVIQSWKEDGDIEGELEFWLTYYRWDFGDAENTIEVDVLNDIYLPEHMFQNKARRAALGRA